MKKNDLKKLFLLFLFGILAFPQMVFATGNREWKWPVPASNSLSSCYLDGRSHYALDISAAGGSSIYASYPGTVIYTYTGCSYDYGKSSNCPCGNCGNLGNSVYIKHSYNGVSYVSRYGHLRSVKVSVGQTVTKDTVIGTVGSTGYSSGNHLDFRIYKGTTTSHVAARDSMDPFKDNFLEMPSGLNANAATTACCYAYVEEVKAQYLDSESPVISNIQITDVSNTGYTVTCTISDDVGVTSVQFPTWPSVDESGQPVWHEGTISGNTATCRINVSEHGNKVNTNYITHIYVYDAAGNSNACAVDAIYIDASSLTITNVQITDVSNTGYTVTCTVLDDVGVTSAKFPTWPSADESGQPVWHEGTISGNTVTCRINVSEHGNKVNTNYITHIYVYDAAGNSSACAVDAVYIDASSPTITNVRITDVSLEGYTVLLTVWDDIKLDKVMFETWTPDNNGDDDYVNEWKNIDPKTGNVVLSYQVKTSEHNNETGRYATRVYVYDEAGNCTDIICNASIGENVYEPVAKAVYGGHTYELYDATFGHWTTAKTYCDSINGYLACITSAEEQAVVNELLKNGTKSGYWAGGTDQYVEGSWTWVTSENVTYTNWKSGEPNDTDGNSDYMVVEQSGKWTDYVELKVEENDISVYGFICELPYEEHLHSYISNVTKEATCEGTGIKTYACSCGDTYTETIKATGHKYNNGSCSNCGAADPDYRPPVSEEAPQIIVESKSASAGDSIDVTIALKNNPGVASMKLKVTFDSLLTLENITYNSSIGGQSQQPQKMTSPVTLNWYNGSADSEGDWTFATLTFRVSENAEADETANVTVTYNADDVYDISETNVDFEVQNGTITISDYLPGDINGDGVVNNKDLTRLFQYLSDWDVEVVNAALDVNGDGSINNKDQTRLFQYLSDWDVVIY